MANYRKIYIEAFGEIPKDEDGRSFEIHHIDGDRSNNNLDNLLCVSILDHYNIHYKQEDYLACVMIASRMNNPPHDLSFLATKQVVTEETKTKLRILAKKQYEDPVQKQKHLQACLDKNANHKNSIWINDGKKNKRIYEHELNEYFELGFNRGRMLGEIKFYEHGNRKRDKFGKFTTKESL